VPAARKTVTRASTTQPVEEETPIAQTSTAARISTVPGSTGTRMPTRPTAMASATSTSVQTMGVSLSQRRDAPATRTTHGSRDATSPGRSSAWGSWNVGGVAGSALSLGARRGVDQLAGLVLDGHRDLAELVAVLPRVVRAEQEVAAAGELDTEVGLGTATVTAVEG
jgi:hypothetical protein